MTLTLEQGRHAMLYPADTSDEEFVVAPVLQPSGTRNHWGLRLPQTEETGQPRQERRQQQQQQQHVQRHHHHGTRIAHSAAAAKHPPHALSSVMLDTSSSGCISWDAARFEAETRAMASIGIENVSTRPPL